MQASSPSELVAPSNGNGSSSHSGTELVERFEQWEEWDASVPFWKHAVAGSCAGLMEHVAMFPLDTVKTHMQALRPGGEPVGLSSVVRGIVQENGVMGFMRGASAIATGCIPAHIALFTSYEFSRRKLLSVDADASHEPVRAAFCGASATFCHDVILTPMDVVKQRMQLGCYRGIADCMDHVVRREGFSGLFRSMPTTLAMNVPFGGVLVATNESLKKVLRIGTQQSRTEDTWSVMPWYFLAAGLSGAVASASTQPLDVVKTRLQTQDCLLRDAASSSSWRPPSAGGAAPSAEAATGGSCGQARQVLSAHDPPRTASCKGCPSVGGVVQAVTPKYSGFIAAVGTILKEEGASALFHGLLPRMLHAIPSAGMCWGTYETVKFLLGC